MLNSQQLEDISQRLARVMPPGLKNIQSELEDNFKVILQSSLEKLDLVSREQFETQKAVLLKTRSRLEALEKRLNELENTQ